MFKIQTHQLHIVQTENAKITNWIKWKTQIVNSNSKVINNTQISTCQLNLKAANKSMIFSIRDNPLQGEEIDLFPSKIVHSPLWHNPFNSIFTFKRDKSKASWSPSAMVKHNLMLNHLPIWGEVLLQFIWKDHISHVLHLKQKFQDPTIWNAWELSYYGLIFVNIMTMWHTGQIAFFVKRKNASVSNNLQ